MHTEFPTPYTYVRYMHPEQIIESDIWGLDKG